MALVWLVIIFVAFILSYISTKQYNLAMFSGLILMFFAILDCLYDILKELRNR